MQWSFLLDLDEHEDYEFINAEAEKILEEHLVVYNDVKTNLEHLISVIHKSTSIDNVINTIHNLEEIKLKNKSETDALYNEYKFRFKLRLQQFEVAKKRKLLMAEANNKPNLWAIKFNHS